MFKLGKSVIIGAVSATILAGVAGYFYLENSGWVDMKNEKGVVDGKIKRFDKPTIPMSEVNDLFRKQLLDADSAKIIVKDSYIITNNLVKSEKLSIVCGEVNAKNSFGAYLGYKPFVVEKDVSDGAKDWVNLDIDVLAETHCDFYSKKYNQGKN